MREERGKIGGDLAIDQDTNLWGTVGGTVTVKKGAKLYVRGQIYGSLVVEDGGRCHVFGNIAGNLTVYEGAKVIHSGVLGGDAINRGGRLYIQLCSKVMGRVKEHAGTTEYEKPGDAFEAQQTKDRD